MMNKWLIDNRHRNTLYYTEEEFQKHLNILLMKIRCKKINKIIKNEKNNRISGT